MHRHHHSFVHRSKQNSNHSLHSVHVSCQCAGKGSKGVTQHFAPHFQAGWVFLAAIPAVLTTFDSHRWSPGCFQPGPFVRQTVSLFCCSVMFRRVSGFLLSANKEGNLRGAGHRTQA